jgi:hypothetical protein
MKHLLNSISSLVFLLCCAVAGAEERPWSFVTTVGGFQIGAPVQSNGKWSLPVRADVSGLQVITNEPTTINSALVCNAIKAQVHGSDIFLVLETGVAHGTGTSKCPDAKLGKLAKGSYNVWYGTSRANGVSLGVVRVAL